jgi:hypothetical protein
LAWNLCCVAYIFVVCFVRKSEITSAMCACACLICIHEIVDICRQLPYCLCGSHKLVLCYPGWCLDFSAQ